MGYNKTHALADLLKAEAQNTIKFLLSEGISIGEAISPHQGWTTGIGWDADVDLLVAELLGKKRLGVAEEAVYLDHYVDAIKVEEKEVLKAFRKNRKKQPKKK